MDPLPLSLLNDFLFCNRRAGLKVIDGLRRANVHTVTGDLAHEHADLPGYETAKGVTLLRALPVWSDRLGLSGKCDIVEQHPGGGLVPVEYKKSKRRHFDNDDAQLCAQALCLEEMFGRPVERGAVFHAASKRRREVAFTAELRATTEHAAKGLHALLGEAERGGELQISDFKFQRNSEGKDIGESVESQSSDLKFQNPSAGSPRGFQISDFRFQKKSADKHVGESGG